MKALFSLLLLTLIFSASFAQQKNLKVQVLTEAAVPLAGATVTLLNRNNSVNASIPTDEQGLVQFQIKDTGTYKINVTAVGMQNYTGEAFRIINIDLALETIKISLQKNAIGLATVTVTAKKKFIEIQADKTVLNIEGSINAVGSTAFELIKKAPGVTADKDENLKLKVVMVNTQN